MVNYSGTILKTYSQDINASYFSFKITCKDTDNSESNLFKTVMFLKYACYYKKAKYTFLKRSAMIIVIFKKGSR